MNIEDFIYSHNDKDIHRDIKKNVEEFILRNKEMLVYRGVTSRISQSSFTKKLTVVGEKGNYFRKRIFKDEERENKIVNHDQFDEFQIKSHCSSSGPLSMYVSTTKKFEIAKQFANDYCKGKDGFNAYIILVYIDSTEDEKFHHAVTRTESEYSEEEVIFLHAIFANQIIGVFSKDGYGEFKILNISPWLYKKAELGIVDCIDVDQSKFKEYSCELGYDRETWKTGEEKHSSDLQFLEHSKDD